MQKSNQLPALQYALETVIGNLYTGRKGQVRVAANRYNFACPYCGDSHTDASKKRGNLYLDTLTYKCFNCGKWSSFDAFIRDTGIDKFMETGVLGALKIKATENRKQILIDRGRIKKTQVLDILEHALPRKGVMVGYGLKEVNTDREVLKMLRDRGQLKTEPLERYAIDRKRRKLVIFNCSPDYERVLSITLRRLGDYGPKYVYKGYLEMCEELGVPKEGDDAEKVNLYGSVYNIMHLRSNVPILVEGPFDANAVPNAIGIQNVPRWAMPDEGHYMYDRDEAGRRMAMEKLEQGNYVFLWDRFASAFPEINVNKKEDPASLGLKMDLRNTSLMPYFSNDPLDLLDL